MTTTQKETAGVAIASLVLGILGLILLGPLGSIPAVICGHVAMSRIKKSPDDLEGNGMALAGLILGYVQIGLMVVMIPLMAAIAFPAIAKAKERAERAGCVNNMRQIELAKEQWALQENRADRSGVDTNGVNQFIGGATPICPAGGTYEYSPVGVDPTCSVHGRPGEVKP
jgi:hypothetical protein